RRDAARQHDKKVHGEILRGFEDVANAIEAEDIGVFVGVNHDCAGSVRDDGANKFRSGEHGALHVKMSVNQAGRQVRAVEIDCGPRAVVAETDDTSVLDGDVCFVDFPAENVNDAGIFECQLGTPLAARHGKLLMDVAHKQWPVVATLAHFAPCKIKMEYELPGGMFVYVERKRRKGPVRAKRQRITR